MTKLLVKFSGNWADEMDIKGFEIVGRDWWEKYKDKFPEDVGEFFLYVGSNQDMTFCGKAEYFRCFTTIEITEEEEKLLVRLFGSMAFGKVPWYENFDMDD